MLTLGFDTSNYTTSVAAFDGVGGRNCSRLLDVKPGELGLRQSDALFAHVKRLPELVQALCSSVERRDITAIGVSTRPRAVEGSYMPCFLAGWSQASCLAQILGVPLYEFSHQQGHIAASLWSAGRLDLMQVPHLAWHLSGGVASNSMRRRKSSAGPAISLPVSSSTAPASSSACRSRPENPLTR